jgi:hypothetical protein
MTNEELETMRLKMRLQMRDQLISIAVPLAASTPAGEQALRRWGIRAREQTAALRWPGSEPATATLMQAEYSEALEEMLGGLGL